MAPCLSPPHCSLLAVVLTLVSVLLVQSSATSSSSPFAAASATSPNNWHRLGLGRTIHSFAHATDDAGVIVLTAFGVVARLDLGTAAIRWRILPPNPANPNPNPSQSPHVHPVAATTVAQPSRNPVLLVLLSDHTLRAIDPNSASILWHHAPVCRIALYINDLAKTAVYAEACTTPDADGDANVDHDFLDPATGTRLINHAHDNTNLSFVTHFDLTQLKHRLLSWPVQSAASHNLVSQPDGVLRLVTRSSGDGGGGGGVGDGETTVWYREDGIAHVSSAAIFPFHSPSSPLVVVLSTLGSLFAISESPSPSSSSSSSSPPSSSSVSSENTTVRWKLDVGHSCVLLPALRDHAVIVCTLCLYSDNNSLDNDGEGACEHDPSDSSGTATSATTSTRVRAIRVSDGTVTFEQTKTGFSASRAALEPCRCDLCVIATDAYAKSEHLFTSCAASSGDGAGDNGGGNFGVGDTQSTSSSSSSSSSTKLPISSSDGFGWLVYSIGGKELTGVRNGKTTWRLPMPNDATISTIASYAYPMSLTSASTTSILKRPAPVRVTGSRELLHKYVDEDTILVLAHDQNNAELHALIVDARTGNLYDARTHAVANPPVSAVRGDHWFVYAFWNSAMLQHELQVIDMYDPQPTANTSSWVGHTVRAAVRALFGREIMSALGIPDPDFTVACRPPPSTDLPDDDDSNHNREQQPNEQQQQQPIINDSSSDSQPESSSSTTSSSPRRASSRTISVSDCSPSRSHNTNAKDDNPCGIAEYNAAHANKDVMQCTTTTTKERDESNSERYSDYHLFMETLAKRQHASLSSSASSTGHHSTLFSFPSFSSQSASSSSASSPYFHSRSYRQRPTLVRSSMLLTKRVTKLDVTQTTLGITQPAVIMTLENGQVTLVPKYLLDARRPAKHNYFKDNLQPYEPVLFLESAARRSVYVAQGAHVPGIKQILVAPSNIRESSTLLVVLGIDIVFSVIQPVGSFDALAKDDFVYSGVVAMVVGLSASVLYTNRLKIRMSMKKSW